MLLNGQGPRSPLNGQSQTGILLVCWARAQGSVGRLLYIGVYISRIHVGGLRLVLGFLIVWTFVDFGIIPYSQHRSPVLGQGPGLLRDSALEAFKRPGRRGESPRVLGHGPRLGRARSLYRSLLSRHSCWRPLV